MKGQNRFNNGPIVTVREANAYNKLGLFVIYPHGSIQFRSFIPRDCFGTICVIGKLRDYRYEKENKGSTTDFSH